jgi:hypothetical protein
MTTISVSYGMAMKPRTEQFCRLVAAGHRPTSAARQVGVRDGIARQTAHRWMQRADVTGFIQSLKEDGQIQKLNDVPSLLSEIEKIALDARQHARDRLRALELLGKHFQAFKTLDEESPASKTPNVSITLALPPEMEGAVINTLERS